MGNIQPDSAELAQRHLTVSPSGSKGIRLTACNAHPDIILQIGGNLKTGELFSKS